MTALSSVLAFLYLYLKTLAKLRRGESWPMRTTVLKSTVGMAIGPCGPVKGCMAALSSVLAFLYLYLNNPAKLWRGESRPMRSTVLKSSNGLVWSL